MVYLWQQTDGDWRRRQKYTIKNEESWQEEAEAVETVLDVDSTTVATTQGAKPQQGDTEPSQGKTTRHVDEFDQLNREIDKHLSDAQSK